jgi:predicted nucleic acid-binding protein
MRMIVDANIVISAILGSAVKLNKAVDRGLELMVPDVQLLECVNVLTGKLGFEVGQARLAVETLASAMTIISADTLRTVETDARERLQPRGQPDWPVLAAAMLLDGHIWSKDRDFFGVGVPVWSNENIRFAQGDIL